MTKVIKQLIPMVFLVLVMVGCAGGGSVSENKPIAEVVKEAESMSSTQLKSVVAKYEKAIEAKKGEVEKVAAKLKEIPLKEMLGDNAKSIKAELSEIKGSLAALTERLGIYAKALKKEMGAMQK